MSNYQGTLEVVAAPSSGARALRGLRHLARTNAVAVAGGLAVLFLCFIALAAPLVAPYDPLEHHYTHIFERPNSAFPFGTDNFGRDVLTRVIYGARVSLSAGIMAVLLGQTLGLLSGVVSGYFGGKVDLALQRIMDTLMSFPTLILALSVVAALGQSLTNVVFAVGLTQIPRAQRIIRSAVIGVRQSQYVEAARGIGCSDWRVIFVHVLPQTVPPLIIVATLELAHAILVEASLSFLGLGIPPPAPSWGTMLSGAGKEFVDTAPWIAIFPGVAISLAVFGFNTLGDGLRDVLDPRLRQGER